jgi:hypothetical protein
MTGKRNFQISLIVKPHFSASTGGTFGARLFRPAGNDHCFGQTMTVRAGVSKHEQGGWPFDTSQRTAFYGSNIGSLEMYFFLRKAPGAMRLFFEEYTLPCRRQGLLRSGRTEFWMHMAKTMINAALP